ncbi:hypothetical protein HHI36_007412 [Cryptolaemus montrouzieri]|uniref:Uncharacterized protein n=1 Tax=Cryptolaemus montrouzieri TaxID=559131 RepID=A0ABD2MPX6_9CUCU
MTCDRIQAGSCSFGKGYCGSYCCAQPPVSSPICYNPPVRCKPCKSVEIIGGEFLRGCDCLKHNGLQDNCKRSECRGSPWCRSRPWACCRPSQFSGGKHLTRMAIGMQMYL